MLNDAMGFSKIEDPEKKKILRLIDELSWGFEYHQKFKLRKGVTFSLGRAGHILGSCFIRFEIEKKDNSQEGKPLSVIFSGDLGNKDTPLLCDPDPPSHCDLLLLESTYGNRLHEGRKQRLERLEETLKKAIKDKGKILIPAFSLGRTQEILYELDRLFAAPTFQKFLVNTGIHKLPVVVDSPLGIKLTTIYTEQKAHWDSEAQEHLRKGNNPIDFEHLYSSITFRDHQQLIEMPGPAIIIAGSGMCTGGRIIDHLAASLENAKTDILFVGYQAQGTLGRKIMEQSGRGNGTVSVAGNKIRLLAAVHTLSGYSAHADQQGLIDWVASMPQKPGAIKLIHGEAEAQAALSKKLREQGYNVHNDHT